jgi:molybdenum cofactor biosynthesis enzyme MoaA
MTQSSQSTQPAVLSSQSKRGPRLQTIATNQRCNQNCVYCNRRAETDDLAAIAPRALQAAIRRALGQGTEEIRLTGGEPTMRRDLVDLVQFAKQNGAVRVALETNATLLDLTRAHALAAAGLTTARVNLVGPDARVDAVTQDAGGFTRTIEGIRALLQAGVAVEILCALTRSTQHMVTEMPAALLARIGDVGRPQAIEVSVPHDAPDAAELLDYATAGELLKALDAACRAHAIPLRLAPDSGPPPCIFPPKRGLPHLYALSPGTRHLAHHSHVAACENCIIADRCSGLADAYLQHFALPVLHPVTDEKAKRRLNTLRPLQEQIAEELVAQCMSADANGAPVFDAIIRINFHCNQACAFCFVSTHLPSATDVAIEDAIRAAGARGERIVLSGGEPTLNPRLHHWIALAKEVSAQPVCLQTNAIRLDNAELCASVIAAGVEQAFVSLHGSTPDVGDAVTDTPGTFVRTLRGLDNLYAQGMEVVLNFVLCEANQHEFADFIRLVAARWPKALANYSFVTPSTDLVPKDKRLIPKFSAMLPFLSDGLRVAEDLGVRVVGFESMCGIPLCLVPESFDRAQMVLPPIPEGTGEGEYVKFVKSAECAVCIYNDRCYGLREGYAELHGTDELHAIRGELRAIREG